MNEDCYHEQNSCYDSNSFSFDQYLPQQLPVIYQTPLEESMKNLRIDLQAWSENIQQKKEDEEKQIAEEQAAKARYWKIPICYDDEEDYTISITHKEPDNSLSMRDEHLDTILATESDEFIKSSVENLAPNPRWSLHLASEPRIDSLLDEFIGELILLKSISPRIDKADCDPKEEIRLVKRLFDPLMEDIDLFFASDGSIPPGIDNAYSDSEGDNLFLERFLHDDPIPLPDILDFSNVVRVFLSFFTYPVTSSIFSPLGVKTQFLTL
nr:hypothetical protein [Tanacetum cinerariifolium]